jgi:hypothetical protein
MKNAVSDFLPKVAGLNFYEHVGISTIVFSTRGSKKLQSATTVVAVYNMGV